MRRLYHVKQNSNIKIGLKTQNMDRKQQLRLQQFKHSYFLALRFDQIVLVFDACLCVFLSLWQANFVVSISIEFKNITYHANVNLFTRLFMQECRFRVKKWYTSKYLWL